MLMSALVTDDFLFWFFLGAAMLYVDIDSCFFPRGEEKRVSKSPVDNNSIAPFQRQLEPVKVRIKRLSHEMHTRKTLDYCLKTRDVSRNIRIIAPGNSRGQTQSAVLNQPQTTKNPWGSRRAIRKTVSKSQKFLNFFLCVNPWQPKVFREWNSA